MLVLIYVIFVIAVGIIIRIYTLGNLDDLWISRMDKPKKLYRMVVAIMVFRNAKKVEN